MDGRSVQQRGGRLAIAGGWGVLREGLKNIKETWLEVG